MVLVECPAGHRYDRRGKTGRELVKTMYCPRCGFRVSVRLVSNKEDTGDANGATARNGKRAGGGVVAD